MAVAVWVPCFCINLFQRNIYETSIKINRYLLYWLSGLLAASSSSCGCVVVV